MNFKKTLSLFAVALMAGAGVGALASCGQSYDIVIYHTLSNANSAKLDAIIKAYQATEEGKGVTISASSQGTYDQIKTKLTNSIPAHTLPTMGFCYPDHVADYMASGKVVKLNDLIAANWSETEKADYGIYWDECTSYDNDESVYSLPFSKSTELMFYNQSFFAEHAELHVPQVWYFDSSMSQVDIDAKHAEGIYSFEEMAQIMKDDYDKCALGYDSDDNLFITLCKQLNVDYTSIGSNGVGSLDWGGSTGKGSEGARAIIERIKTWYTNGWIITKGTNSSGDYTSTLFGKENCMMTVSSSAGAKYCIQSAAQAKAARGDGATPFATEVTTIPQQGNGGVISQGPSICFFQDSNITEDQVEKSFKFYTYLTNTENSAAYNIVAGYDPVRYSSLETTTWENHLAETTATDTTDALKAKVSTLTASAAVTDHYFFSSVFQGSATSRTEVGSIISGVCVAGKTTDKAFSDAFALAAFALPIVD